MICSKQAYWKNVPLPTVHVCSQLQTRNTQITAVSN